jgi:hypothetical protein
MWGFFLDFSRPLNDFKKYIICHAMQCILCKIIFRRIVLYTRQFDTQPICTPIIAKFYSCKKWVLQGVPKRYSYHALLIL